MTVTNDADAVVASMPNTGNGIVKIKMPPGNHGGRA